MEYTKGKWENDRNRFISTSNHCIAEMNNIGRNVEADANLIVVAVNACASVNPDNPMAVAESIKEMYEALKHILVLDDNYNHSLGQEYFRADVIKLVNKTLAKAEGK